LVERIKVASAWLVCPRFAGGFGGFEAWEWLEPAAEIVCVDEVGQVAAKLFVGLVVEALDGRFLEGSIHVFDLTVGLRVSRLGQTVVDVALGACILEGMSEEDLALIDGLANVGGGDRTGQRSRRQPLQGMPRRLLQPKPMWTYPARNGAARTPLPN